MEILQKHEKQNKYLAIEEWRGKKKKEESGKSIPNTKCHTG